MRYVAWAILGLVSSSIAWAEAPLHLLWNDSEGVFIWRPTRVQREVQEIFSRSGISLCWDEETTGASREIRIVLRPARAERWGLKPRTMGLVFRRTEQTPVTAVYVFLPSLLEALGLDGTLREMPAPRERSFIDRALARVIAHEVVHALVPELSHRDNGLMRARLTRRWLTSGEDVSLDPATVTAIETTGGTSSPGTH